MTRKRKTAAERELEVAMRKLSALEEKAVACRESGEPMGMLLLQLLADARDWYTQAKRKVDLEREFSRKQRVQVVDQSRRRVPPPKHANGKGTHT